MKGLLILALKHKAMAMAAVAVLSAGSAATFASQDIVPLGDPGGPAQVVGQDEQTPTVEPTATVEEEETATPTPTPEQIDEDTPTPEPTEVVEPTPTAAAEDGDDEEEGPRDVVGIPDDNPSKQPENGDGVCDKGETVIKTTPSGKQVNVPCQAVMKDHGSKAKDGDGGIEDEEGTE
jgi:outer membrane biosynthesis protein TonB